MASPLDHDLDSLAFTHGVRQGFWALEGRDGDRVFVTLIARDTRTFLLCLEAGGYPAEPLLGQFVDPSTRQPVASAWPQGDETLARWLKWQPGELFVCWPGDRGGIQRHPEWRAQRYWERSQNPLVAYLDFMRQRLWSPSYRAIPVAA